MNKDRVIPGGVAQLLNIPGVVAGQGTIVAAVALGNTGVVSFNPLAAAGNNELAIERRLPISDTFAITHMGFFLGKVTGTVTDAKLAKMVKQTYPNSSVFSAANDAANLEAIYNGFLTIGVNQVNYIDGLDMQRFRTVPTSQQGTTTTQIVDVAGTGLETTTQAASGYGQDVSTFGPLTPAFYINGKDNLKFSVELPEATDLNVDTGNTENYAIFVLRGYKIADGANF